MLRGENVRLHQEVYELRSKADAETEQRQLLEEENRRLYDCQELLQTQVREYAGTVDYFRNSIARCFSGMDKVLPILMPRMYDHLTARGDRPHQLRMRHILFRLIYSHTGLPVDAAIGRPQVGANGLELLLDI